MSMAHATTKDARAKRISRKSNTNPPQHLDIHHIAHTHGRVLPVPKNPSHGSPIASTLTTIIHTRAHNCGSSRTLCAIFRPANCQLPHTNLTPCHAPHEALSCHRAPLAPARSRHIHSMSRPALQVACESPRIPLRPARTTKTAAPYQPPPPQLCPNLQRSPQLHRRAHSPTR